MTTELNFKTAPVPEIQRAGRKAAPNPFAGHFPTPEGESLVLELVTQTDEEKAYVKTLRNQAQAQARRDGFTGNVKTEPMEIGTGRNKKEGTRVYVWTSKQIHRPRKTDNGSEASSKASKS